MKNLTKIALGAAMVGGIALTTAAPAAADVSVGIGFGPGYHHNWCYYHPYRCGNYGRPVYYDGYYDRDRGYYWHHSWYRHRDWDRDHWRYDRDR